MDEAQMNALADRAVPIETAVLAHDDDGKTYIFLNGVPFYFAQPWAARQIGDALFREACDAQAHIDNDALGHSR